MLQPAHQTRDNRLLPCGEIARHDMAARLADYKAGLGAKIEKANKELAEVKYEYKTN